MSLIYKQGDLLQAFENGEVEIICHQENCVSKGYYGGIAKIIHEKYPETIDAIKFFGNVIYNQTKHGIIANIYSQYYPGAPNDNTFIKDKYQLQDNFYNRIVALEECLQKVKTDYHDKRIGLCLIASGLAKQSNAKHYTDLNYFEEFIAPIIEKCLNKMDVTIYYL